MRKPDAAKDEKILRSIRSHPEGAYVSEIARETGVTKSTVSFLLSGRLAGKVEVVKVGRGGLFKMFRARPKK